MFIKLCVLRRTTAYHLVLPRATACAMCRQARAGAQESLGGPRRALMRARELQRALGSSGELLQARAGAPEGSGELWRALESPGEFWS
eukprot:9586326-Alexandrium_andersonii.AAC.1